jgi:predicted transcriptional regulator
MKIDLPPKRDEIIRFRAESELKARIARLARKQKKKPAELLRDYLWKIVDQEMPEGRA